MYDERDLILSPLQQTYRADGKSVRIQIYRMPDTDWTLEVVDEYNNSTVWDDLFVSDADALRVALEELEADGIEAYIGLAPGERSHWIEACFRRWFGQLAEDRALRSRRTDPGSQRSYIGGDGRAVLLLEPGC